MPESVSDRPTRAHEQLFMLVKAERYYYDRIAVLEPLQSGPSDLRKIAEQRDRIGGKTLTDTEARHKANASTNIGQKRAVGSLEGRNRRSVWRIATEPYSGAHFAAFPRKLVEPCLLSSTSPHVCKACRSALKSGATGASRFRPRSSLV